MLQTLPTNKLPHSKATSWFFLVISVVFEVFGTSLLKVMQAEHPTLSLIIIFAIISVSYFLLSKSLFHIPVGVAYAFWEGAGLVLITVAATIFLGEIFTPVRAIGLSCVLGGIILINAGIKH